MLILIDADPIVYRCGFASEMTSWRLIYEDEAGEVKEVLFSPDEKTNAGAKMRDWLALNAGKVTVLDKSRVVTPDPVSYALRATKVQIESIIEECESHYKQPGKMLMWISGKGGSYRDKIATVKPYKGNRDPTHKPYHYDAIRDYLRERYGSYITHGIEADDAVSIFARNHYESNTEGESLVIATIDKDLDQIPGNHYNYMNKVFYAITQTEAERFFVFQCLAGDDTDNVGGVWKCGDKAAESILERNRSLLDRRRSSSSRSISSDGKSDERVPSETSRRGGNVAVVGEGTSNESNRQSDESVGPEAGDSSCSGRSAVGRNDLRRVREHDSTTAARPNAIKSVYKWWPVVVRAYADSQRKPGCPYAKADPEAIAIENARLVKLQEYPKQLWDPYGDRVVPEEWMPDGFD